MRQPVPKKSASISQPARIGPPTEDRPMTGPNMPNAAPISFGGNISLIMPSPCGSITAPNRPWTPADGDQHLRATGDTAHSSEPAVNPAAPMRNIRLRPYDVAEPAAGDQADGHGQRVARRRATGSMARGAAEVGPDRRARRCW